MYSSWRHAVLILNFIGCFLAIQADPTDSRTYRVCNLSSSGLNGYLDYWFTSNNFNFSLPAANSDNSASNYQEIDVTADVKKVYYAFDNIPCSMDDDGRCMEGWDSTGSSSTFIYANNNQVEAWGSIDDVTDCLDAASILADCQVNAASASSTCGCPNNPNCASEFTDVLCVIMCLADQLSNGGDPVYIPTPPGGEVMSQEELKKHSWKLFEPVTDDEKEAHARLTAKGFKKFIAHRDGKNLALVVRNKPKKDNPAEKIIPKPETAQKDIEPIMPVEQEAFKEITMMPISDMQEFEQIDKPVKQDQDIKETKAENGISHQDTSKKTS